MKFKWPALIFALITLSIALHCGCQQSATDGKTTKTDLALPAETSIDTTEKILPEKPKEKSGGIGQLFMQKKDKTATEVPIISGGQAVDKKKPEINPATVIEPGRDMPHIQLESVIHNYGEVDPSTKYVSRFKFTNTGKATLIITSVRGCCGVVTRLAKETYAPGESGVLEAEFQTFAKAGIFIRQIGLSTNDPLYPQIELTIKASVVPKVSCEPSVLQLVLNKENAGCPEIRLTSLDGKLFAITRFSSTLNCLTADIDPAKEATSFVLQPIVDMNALKKVMAGIVRISLSHPACGEVNIMFNGLAEYKISPPQLYVIEAEPLKPIVRELWILSNYGNSVEVESTISLKNTIKVLDEQKTSNGLQFKLEITPPEMNGQKKFSDTFIVKLKGDKKLSIMCHGFYKESGTDVLVK